MKQPPEPSETKPETPSNTAKTVATAAEAATQAVAQVANGNRMVPRVISLIMLVAVVLLVAAMFFRVMLQFVAPLFLAGVLVVVFEPLHKRVVARLPGRPQWAALATTALVGLMLLLPITWLGLNAFGELKEVVSNLNEDSRHAVIEKLKASSESFSTWYNETTGQDLWEQVREASGSAAETLVASGVDTVFAVFGFLFGLGIMAFAMYYFLADGPAMVEAFVHLSPLDDEYERELLAKFAEVSRAVVVATLLSAAAQGLLAGVGYYFALDGGPVFLLTAVTMLMAIVPFVGATIIWIPVVAWVYFYQGDTAWAIALGLWCAIVVSNIDNVIKPFVLHGQSNLHPLLALLSVMGGVSVLGPVGILVGPMLVAFLQALLNMLRKEIDLLQKESEAPAGSPKGAETA